MCKINFSKTFDQWHRHFVINYIDAASNKKLFYNVVSSVNYLIYIFGKKLIQGLFESLFKKYFLKLQVNFFFITAPQRRCKKSLKGVQVFYMNWQTFTFLNLAFFVSNVSIQRSYSTVYSLVVYDLRYLSLGVVKNMNECMFNDTPL